MQLLLCFSGDEEVIKVNENTWQISKQIKLALKIDFRGWFESKRQAKVPVPAPRCRHHTEEGRCGRHWYLIKASGSIKAAKVSGHTDFCKELFDGGTKKCCRWTALFNSDESRQIRISPSGFPTTIIRLTQSVGSWTVVMIPASSNSSSFLFTRSSRRKGRWLVAHITWSTQLVPDNNFISCS